MEFEECDYNVQQVKPRTRNEKINSVDRDMIDKQRLVNRKENFQRNPFIENIVKPEKETPFNIDDIDRFERDFTKDQKEEKEFKHILMLSRAAGRKKLQDEYEKSILLRREVELEDENKRKSISSKNDFNEESVLYDPITNNAPFHNEKKENSLKDFDNNKEFRRDARAKRIYHSSNSVSYDPITGEKRNFW